MSKAKATIDWREVGQIALFLGANPGQIAKWQVRKEIPKGWAKAIELEKDRRGRKGAA